MPTTTFYDVIIIGAGAAGLMAAIQAGKRQKSVLLLEASNKIAEKIRISGGGRCNFTNLHTTHANYISSNPHFVKSALAQYDQHDFIKLVASHNIAYHEKTLGQLFCDGSSTQIIKMLLDECASAAVKIVLNCAVTAITKSESFNITTSLESFCATSLIIATGGLSIPTIGATDFGYRIATQFGLNIIPTYPALVPLTVPQSELAFCQDLRGISNPSITHYGKAAFKENILFTHLGLSGPAILQISSYISNPQDKTVTINLLPEISLLALLTASVNKNLYLQQVLSPYFPKRLLEKLCFSYSHKKLGEYKKNELEQIAQYFHSFTVKLQGSQGYNKAEVTAGGVDTAALSSKSMEARQVAGLYFVGEVVDVTGWLGGYNFQWAWSSGYVAGMDA
jgi:predicted Rossmann fold flavoprotein